MSGNTIALFQESINLELNIGNLYSLYNDLFPEDSTFWWKLAFEEKNHAALIRSGQEYFDPVGEFPHELIIDNLQKLKETNERILSTIKSQKINPPNRQEAFNQALALENSAGELHFQSIMEGETDSKAVRLFKKLNKDDKDHARKISAYMKKHGISINTDLE